MGHHRPLRPQRRTSGGRCLLPPLSEAAVEDINSFTKIFNDAWNGICLVIELYHDFLPLAICSGIRIFFVVSFVFISSEFRQTFRRVLCGKTFCHNILPQKRIVNISSNNSFKFRQTWVEVTKSLTKFQRNSHDHFLWQKVWQNGLPQGLPRNLQRKL